MGVQVPPPAPNNNNGIFMSLSVQKVREQDATVDFKATLAPNAYETELNNWFSKKSKNVSVAGFRPGKVPISIVKTKYMGDATNSVVNTLVDQAIREIVKEHKLRIAGQPKVTIETADSDKGFECKLEVECLPEITLKDFSAVECEELVVEINKSDTDEYLKNLHESHVGFEKELKKGKAEWGDKVVVIAQENLGKVDSKPQELHLIKDVEDPVLKTMLEAIVGHSTGDKFEVTLKDPNSKKETTLHIALEAVHASKKFKLDDEFAKEYGVENLDALRAKLTEVHTNDHKKLTNLYHKRQILDSLHNQYNFALPKSAVEFEFQQIWSRLQDEIAASKGRGDVEEDINLDEVKVEYQKIAERRVKLGLVVSEIAKVHKIELTNEDIQKAIIEEATKNPNYAKEIIEYYTKNREALQSLSAPLIEDKVVSFIFEKAKKKQTKIGSKELPSKLKGVLPGYDDDSDDSSKKTAKKTSKESSSEDTSAPAKKATKKKGE